MNEMPKTEVTYQWRELATVEGEDKPRLLIPWADPMEYEFAFDFMYPTPEAAIEAKDVMAPNENWYLVKVTVEPLQFVEGEEPIDDPLTFQDGGVYCGEDLMGEFIDGEFVPNLDLLNCGPTFQKRVAEFAKANTPRT